MESWFFLTRFVSRSLAGDISWYLNKWASPSTTPSRAQQTNRSSTMVLTMVMLRRSLLLLLILALSTAQELLWSDEFDGSVVDSNVWSFDTGSGGWGNEELQTYSQDNVKVENGNLVITVTKDDNVISSGRIHTNNNLQLLYGRIEARIQIPDPANGLWPSLWMLGTNFDEVGWPKSGSMTMMQMGSEEALQLGKAKSHVGSAFHWEASQGGVGVDSNEIDSGMDLTSDFHTYVMEWTPDSITTFVDGTRIMRKDISSDGCGSCDEFHRPYFFLLSVAVGGQYMNLLGVDSITAPLPADMMVDYVRIYDNGFAKVTGGRAVFGPPPSASPTTTPTAPPPTTMAPVPTKSPSVSPTVLPTLPPTTKPTASPTVAETLEPTESPSRNPTLSPTASPTAATTPEPTVSTTRSPTSTDSLVPTVSPTISPTSQPVPGNVDPEILPDGIAEGMVMTLTDVKPLNAQSRLDWAKVTAVHLVNEVTNVIGSTDVQVQVTFVSQKPPYEGDVVRRGLRQLQDQEQEIVFDTTYSFTSTMRMDTLDSFVTGAFVSNYKRALYLDRLREFGGNAFQNVSTVSVESSSSTTTNIPGDKRSTTTSSETDRVDVGLIVGVTTACLITMIVAIAFVARRRKRRGPAVIASAVGVSKVNAFRKDAVSHQSGTIADDSMYTRNTLNGKVVPCDVYDNVSSLALSSNFVDDDSISMLSSAPSSEHDYRDTFIKSISKSILGGTLPNTNDDDATEYREFNVEVPANDKLGLVLETFDEGKPIVQEVKASSPFCGRVIAGDRLISVNGRDVTTASSEMVSRVIASASMNTNEKKSVFVFERAQEKKYAI